MLGTRYMHGDINFSVTRVHESKSVHQPSVAWTISHMICFTCFEVNGTLK